MIVFKFSGCPGLFPWTGLRKLYISCPSPICILTQNNSSWGNLQFKVRSALRCVYSVELEMGALCGGPAGPLCTSRSATATSRLFAPDDRFFPA